MKKSEQIAALKVECDRLVAERDAYRKALTLAHAQVRDLRATLARRALGAAGALGMVARGGRDVSATEGHDGDNSLMGWAVVTGTSTPLTFVDEAAHHEFLEALHVITTAPETAAAALLRLGQENAALAAALEDIAGMRELPDGTWVADAECMLMRGRCWEHLGKPDGGPEEWCHTCVAEVAWCAWKLGVLR